MSEEIQTADGSATEEIETPAPESAAPESAAPAGGSQADVVAPEAKSVADAIDAAIDTANKPRTVTPKAEETPEAKAAAEEAARATREKEDTEAAEKGQFRDPTTGKFRAMTDEEKKAHAAAKAKPAGKEDHVNDPIPEGLNERTAARMKSLIDTVKQQAVLAEQHDALFSSIQNTGASPTEFAQMIGYMRMVHSKSPKDLETAYGVLQGELRALAVRLGKSLPEVNLLADKENADLIAEVRAGKLTQERANEIAASRAQKAAAAEATRTAEAAERQKTEAAAATQRGVKALDDLGTELRKRDGDATYVAKKEILVPMLTEHFKRIDPKEWPGIFREMYDKLVVKPQAAPPAPAVPAARTVPLRPKAPAGGGAQGAPKSALEAISQAIDGV